jgi:hypothetical protein
MEDNKKIYLDKILKWFVDDTIIRYETGVIIYPFSPIGPNGKPLPSFIDDLKNKLSWGMPSDVQITCRDTYGLNYDETKYIWDNYKTIIKDRYNKESIMYDLKPINESMDNKKRYLDKVVDFLVEDTKVDHENRMIFFPFTYKRSLRQGSRNLTPFHRLLFDTYIPIDGFMEYIDESFGITSEEGIVYVWESYKVIMRDIVFGNSASPLYFNESVDKISKGEYIDKIIDYLVDDTMVDQKNKVWNPPFPTDHAKPTFNHFYGLIPMADHLELKFLIGNSYVRNFFNYCKDTYGLTDDEEIRKLWKRYLKVLTPKINGFSIINGIPTINESVDRKSDYLDKIVEFLVVDTEISMGEGDFGIFKPSFASIWFSTVYLKKISDDMLERNFFNYCKDSYGLTNSEVKRVWSKYKKNILNIFKVPINESVDRKDDLIDKISDYMVDDTEYELSISQYNVDSTEIFVYIRYPYSAQDSGFPYTIYEVSTIKESSEYILNRVEIEYMWDVYNIRSVKTIEDIFKKYTEKLFTKIYDDMLRVKGNNINESVDRKSDYLDKIVDFMIDDTEYNIYINRFSDHSETKVEIWYPFTNPDEDVDAYDYSIYDIYDWSNGSGFNLDEGEDIDYICNTYSICDIDTVQELYDRYIQKLSTIIYEEMLLKKNGDRLNESVNRKDEYLDKIVEFLVTDTKVLVNDDVFFAPFYRLSSLSFNLLFYKGDYPASFHRYCRDVYGINSDDIKYVWDTYKNIIKDKFNNSGNINESVDRKDEYLDKIVGFIVDDTEITIEKNDKSFKPPFTSVWFSPLYLKLMSDSQLEINFLTYCKDTYGLTNSEIKVVISKYRKTILNKFKGS